ncbi:MAG: ABC transporter ATP-binding protein [Acidimicrobiaceae bacterium]|nr:ABC transporter ATP-binding protein [Acidimicrobiaceae bacterium]MYE98575.1 ABC transporter ATP-binding protein [Acidimicrobiaceae bacterium]MYI54728.1 ABC transporter ATP-binding protein [Acidimicrobiaceae bacterium]
MLSVTSLAGGYGPTQVLYDVSVEVGEGEIVGLLGRNGMGKTTTISTMFGLLAPSSGSISFDGAQIAGHRPFQISRRGLSLVPEGRQVFPLLTVQQNLEATVRASVSGDRRWTVGTVFELFPQLADRRQNLGVHLSGGEQQMLAIGRALVMNPRLLVLDEATEGLAPTVRAAIFAVLRILKEQGQSILIVDAYLQKLLTLTDRNVVIEKGRTVWSGTTEDLIASPGVADRYLGVGV